MKRNPSLVLFFRAKLVPEDVIGPGVEEAFIILLNKCDVPVTVF